MTRSVEFFYDYGSPFSYLADTQMADLEKSIEVTVVYRPMLLGAVLKATGNASPMAVPAKGVYTGLDLRRWAERYGVPFRASPFLFRSNTLRLMRGAIASQRLDVFRAYHRAVFQAVWGEPLDLGDGAVFRGLLEHAAIDPQRLLDAIEAQETKDELRRNTDEAVRRGVFGAPTFFVGEEIFWGNDRLTFVEQALRRVCGGKRG